MLRHHLREVQDLCDYRVTGIGAAASKLEGIVFDAGDWRVRSFIVRQDTPAAEPILVPRSCFRAIDDVTRELALEIPDAMAQPLERFRPGSLGDSTSFDAAALIDQPIRGTDTPAGRIADMLVNVNIWQMRYFVIATGAGHVLTDIEWASSLAEGSDEVRLDLPADAVATAPQYPGLAELCSGHEGDLYRHYTRREFIGRSATG